MEINEAVIFFRYFSVNVSYSRSFYEITEIIFYRDGTRKISKHSQGAYYERIAIQFLAILKAVSVRQQHKAKDKQQCQKYYIKSISRRKTKYFRKLHYWCTLCAYLHKS